MVRFACLKMHSGYSMGKDLAGWMLDVGRLVPVWVPPSQEKTEREDPASTPLLHSPKEKLGFHFHASCEAAPCRAQAAASKAQNPREPLEFTQPTWGASAHRSPRISCSISAEAAEKSCPCLVHSLAWPSEGLSCLALLLRSFISALQPFNFRDWLFLGDMQWGLHLSCSF